MSLSMFLVPPGAIEIAGLLVLVMVFALSGLVTASPTRSEFEGTSGQYGLALGINAFGFLAPLFLWVMPVVRAGQATPFELVIVLAIALAAAYVLLRIARMLPGVGPSLLALDRARRRQKLGGQA